MSHQSCSDPATSSGEADVNARSQPRMASTAVYQQQFPSSPRSASPPPGLQRPLPPTYTRQAGLTETVLRSEQLDRERAREMLLEFNLRLGADGVQIEGKQKDILRAIKTSISNPNREQLAYILFADKKLQLYKDTDSYRPLHWAAYYGCETVMLILITNSVNVNERTDNHWTPLHWAAFFGHTGTITLLLEAGASVNAQTERGLTPLHWASQRGHFETVETLLFDGDAFVNAATVTNSTPLHVAATHGHESIVRLLLNAGASLNEKADNGSTPLHCAAQGGHLQIVRLLVEKGAHVDARCANKKTVRGVTVDKTVKSYLKSVGAVK